jgi:hypothetical protein
VLPAAYTPTARPTCSPAPVDAHDPRHQLLVVMLASGVAELAARVGFTQARELLLPATLVFAVLAAVVRLADQRRVAVASP